MLKVPTYILRLYFRNLIVYIFFVPYNSVEGLQS